MRCDFEFSTKSQRERADWSSKYDISSLRFACTHAGQSGKRARQNERIRLSISRRCSRSITSDRHEGEGIRISTHFTPSPSPILLPASLVSSYHSISRISDQVELTVKGESPAVSLANYPTTCRLILHLALCNSNNQSYL